MRALTLVAALLLSASAQAEEAVPEPQARVASEKELVDDDGYVVRLSMPTQDDVKAWSTPGLRIGLAYSFGQFAGPVPALGLNLHAFTLRVLTRLDELWSVGLDFQYGLATGKLSGLRFGGTLQAMLHPWRQLGVSFGVGYGGLVLIPPDGSAPAIPGTGEEIASFTVGPDARLGSCTGGAWVGLTRVEYPFVVGSLFSTGPFLEVDAQFTQCRQNLGRTNRENGEPIAARQWWFHGGAALGWWATWR